MQAFKILLLNIWLNTLNISEGIQIKNLTQNQLLTLEKCHRDIELKNDEIDHVEEYAN